MPTKQESERKQERLRELLLRNQYGIDFFKPQPWEKERKVLKGAHSKRDDRVMLVHKGVYLAGKHGPFPNENLPTGTRDKKLAHAAMRCLTWWCYISDEGKAIYERARLKPPSDEDILKWVCLDKDKKIRWREDMEPEDFGGFGHQRMTNYRWYMNAKAGKLLKPGKSHKFPGFASASYNRIFKVLE